ncbi:MAG: hypothetical protein Q8P32_05165 [Candidatus Komeilibacteria bacterium]|nr:hypothetical protein [Candidatus Komeilibacteria bacterium]
MNASTNFPARGASKTGKGVVDLRKLNSTGAVKPGARPQAPVKKTLPADFLSSGPSADWHRPTPRFGGPKKKAIKKSGSWLPWVILLLLILAAAAIASFFIFNKGTGGKSLRLTLAVTEAAAAGEEVALEIGYTNLDKVALTGLQAVLEYPEGFYFNTSSVMPANQEENIWDLPELGVGKKETLQIYGQLFGQKGDDKEFTVIFRYNPANFNSDFRETLTQKVKINDELLVINLAAPEKMEDGQTLEFKGSLENEDKNPYAALRWSFDLGEAFSPLTLSPSTTISYQWQLAELAAKQKKELLVSGKVDSTKANPFPWYFKVWQTVKHNDKDQDRIIYQQSGNVEILAPQIKVGLELVNPEQKINWGETIDLKITYENLGKLEVKQAVLKLAFNKYIDWAKFNNSSGATKDGNTLIWLSTSGQSTAKLAVLAPGDKGELTVSVPLVNEPADLTQLSLEELMINAAASAQIRFNNTDKVFESEKLELPVVSQARLQTEARYYLDAGTKVGSGPLPPQIGQETKYRIYWKLFTGSKGLTNVKVKTSLPAYINFVGPIGEPTLGTPLSFDATSRELVWEIADVAPNTALMAVFDLSVTPAENQVNQLLILTNPTLLNASEKQTNDIVSKTANLLTSDLTGDPVAQGKGRVMVK